MRYYFIIYAFIILSQPAFGQEKDFLKGFIKSFERHFTIPADIKKEGQCFHLASLLKVEVDSSCKVSSILFSDIASDWQVQELERIKDKLEVRSIEKQIKKNGKGSLSILFPFIIKKGDNGCGARHESGYFSKLFFLFNKKNIDGKCLFANQIELVYY